MIIKAQLMEDNRLVVWNVEESDELYKSGFFGRPIGVNKPREALQNPLILDAIEGLYLLERKLVEVQESGKKIIQTDKLRKKFRTEIHGFQEKYRVYSELRNRGLIVTPGIKYGCDFAVYEHGPGIDHAPYIIQIQDIKQELEATEIVKSGRLATTVRKSFIIAAIGEEVTYLEFNWWKA